MVVIFPWIAQENKRSSGSVKGSGVGGRGRPGRREGGTAGLQNGLLQQKQGSLQDDFPARVSPHLFWMGLCGPIRGTEGGRKKKKSSYCLSFPPVPKRFSTFRIMSFSQG